MVLPTSYREGKGHSRVKPRHIQATLDSTMFAKYLRVPLQWSPVREVELLPLTFVLRLKLSWTDQPWTCWHRSFVAFVLWTFVIRAALKGKLRAKVRVFWINSGLVLHQTPNSSIMRQCWSFSIRVMLCCLEFRQDWVWSFIVKRWSNLLPFSSGCTICELQMCFCGER